MRFKGKDIDTPPGLRAVISAWLVFLTMLFGSVLFSAIDSIVEGRVEPLVAGDERLAAHAPGAQQTGASTHGARALPPVSKRPE